MVGRAGSTIGTVHADVTLTLSKVNVKVTGLLNFRKLAKQCMHVGGDDGQHPLRSFLVSRMRRAAAAESILIKYCTSTPWAD